MRSFSTVPESPDAPVSANGTVSTPDGKLLLPPAGNGNLLISRTESPVNIENFVPEAAYLSVQVRDAVSGDPISGYLFSDCDSVGQSSIDQTVTWKEKSSLEGISSSSIRVEFQLYGAQDPPQLYSFWFDEN